MADQISAPAIEAQYQLRAHIGFVTTAAGFTKRGFDALEHWPQPKRNQCHGDKHL